MSRRKAAPGTREARINEFHRLLAECPGSSKTAAQTEEAVRRSGMSEADFHWLHRDTDRGDRQADAMIEWMMEQDRAWRREVIGLLTNWEKYNDNERKAVAVALRDFFQHLAEKDV